MLGIEMKSVFLAPHDRLAHGVMRRLFFAAVAIFAVTTSSYAVTTVNWNGTDNFNDASITFGAFKADQLSDIYGSGLYEACCTTGTTNFTLRLKLNGTWTEILNWSTAGDNTTHSLGDLVPPVIDFNLSWVSGIKLTSDPNGKPSSDYNFTNFKFVTYLNRQDYYNLYKEKYKSWDDFVNCGDYERYVRNVTSFVFCIDCVPTGGGGEVPLPASLLLFATGIGGVMGLLGWRRKRKAAAVAA
jgi:hypothetical protein